LWTADDDDDDDDLLCFDSLPGLSGLREGGACLALLARSSSDGEEEEEDLGDGGIRDAELSERPRREAAGLFLTWLFREALVAISAAEAMHPAEI
jgi:hypothetical protein